MDMFERCRQALRGAATVGVVLSATPALAWEFSPLPICTLTHVAETGDVSLVYDPSAAEYAITLRFVVDDRRWATGTHFDMLFLGERTIRIGTDRHQISADATTLTVTDTGFGNVLDGLQFNAIAEGKTGDVSMRFSLTGAAEHVAAFRACGTAATS